MEEKRLNKDSEKRNNAQARSDDYTNNTILKWQICKILLCILLFFGMVLGLSIWLASALG